MIVFFLKDGKATIVTSAQTTASTTRAPTALPAWTDTAGTHAAVPGDSQVAE